MLKKYQYHLFVLFAGISWSTLAIFSAAASRANIDPFSQVFWRILIACSVSFLVATLIFKQKLKLSSRAYRYIFINAVIFLAGFTTFSASIYLGSPIAKAIALNYAYPLPVVILSYMLFKHIPKTRNWLAVLVSLVSVVLLLEVWKIQNVAQIKPGDILAFLNSFAFAGMIVWGTKIRQELKLNPFVVLFFSWAMALPMLLIFGLLMRIMHIPLFNPVFKVDFGFINWLPLIGLGTVSSVLPISLMYYGSSKLKPFVTSVLLLIEPICVYIAGVIFFQQQLSIWGIIGIIGIMISVLLT